MNWSCPYLSRAHVDVVHPPLRPPLSQPCEPVTLRTAGVPQPARDACQILSPLRFLNHTPPPRGPVDAKPVKGLVCRAVSASSTKPLRARLLIVTATVLWSSSGLFAKSTVFDGWPVEDRGAVLAFWRALFAGAVLIPAVRAPRWSLRLVPMALCFSVMNLTFLTAITLTTAANAIWLQYTAPLWVCVMGVLFLGERVLRRNLISLGCGALGVGTILYHELAGQSGAGIAFGLASGLSFAGVVVFIRAFRDYDAAWLVALNHLAAALVLLPYVVHLNLWPSLPQLAVLAAFGFCQMGLPYVLFAQGLRSISSQEASQISLLEPILTPVWAFVAIRELPATWTLWGAGFILAGLLLRYGVGTAKTQPGSEPRR